MVFADDRCGVDDVFLPDLCEDIEPPKKSNKNTYYDGLFLKNFFGAFSVNVLFLS